MIGDTSCLLIGITICNGRGHFGARANFVRGGAVDLRLMDGEFRLQGAS